MGGRSKILGWTVAGLVIMLAILTVIIVRGTSQPDQPDLSPVEVTPEPSDTAEPEETAGVDRDTASDGDTSGRTSDGSDSADADSTDPGQIEHSYEPVPNPPREVPDDDDDDDDDGDDAGDDDDDDGDDDDD